MKGEKQYGGKIMKQKIALILAIALCFLMAVPSFAAVARKEGTIPGTDKTYEYIESCQFQVPGTDTIFTFKNVTATVGYTEDRAETFVNSNVVPTYRFSILGKDGSFSINQDSWIALNRCTDFDCGGGDWGYTKDLVETFKVLEREEAYLYMYKVAIYNIPLDWDEEVEPEGRELVACVEIYMGESVEHHNTNELLLDESWEMLDIETLIIDNNFDPEYQITDGANAQWKTDSKGNLTIKADGDFSKFTGIKVDGKLIEASNYVAKEGSTIVELKADYLKTLKSGKHEITIVYTDGEVSTDFEIKTVNATNNGNTNVNIPNTSANAKAIGSVAALAVVSLLTIVLVSKKKK